MAKAAVIADRRQRVRDLWLIGTPAPKIAKALKVDERTIKRDLQMVRQQLVTERVTDLGQNLARSVAVFKMVQNMAFTTYGKAKVGSQTQVMALNTIADAEVSIAKLEGTMAPESVTAAAVVEVQAAMLDTLAELGPAAVQTFHRKFQARLGGGGRAAASLAIAAPSPAPTPSTPATTVNGSIVPTPAAAAGGASGASNGGDDDDQDQQDQDEGALDTDGDDPDEGDDAE